MALAWVQDGTVTAGAGSPAAATIAIVPTSGNALVVTIVQSGNSSSRTYTVVDNIDGATGWTRNKRDNPGRIEEIWSKPNMPLGVVTVTITQSSTSAFSASVSEFSDLGTVITADATDALVDASAQTHTASAAGVSSSNPVVAVVAANCVSGANECNPGTGYTEITPALADSLAIRQYQIFPSGCMNEVGAWTNTVQNRIGDSIIALLSGNAAAGRTTKNTRANPLGTEIGMGWRMECGAVA